MGKLSVSQKLPSGAARKMSTQAHTSTAVAET